MPNSKISFNQKSDEAALVCQEQEQVIPLVGELENAELDFVAGDGMGICTIGEGMPVATGARLNLATGPIPNEHPFGTALGRRKPATKTTPNHESHSPQKKRHSSGEHAK